jgi:histidine triad (HIT) family protein
MSAKEDCIFCKIISGKLPGTKIYEDDDAVVIMDIMPLNRGHLLVIPKEHFENILEIDPELYGRLHTIVAKTAGAVDASISPEGMNVMQLNGKAGNQVVPHVHIHLVPRWEGDGLTICGWEPVPGDMDDIAASAEEIKAKLPRAVS